MKKSAAIALVLVAAIVFFAIGFFAGGNSESNSASISATAKEVRHCAELGWNEVTRLDDYPAGSKGNNTALVPECNYLQLKIAALAHQGALTKIATTNAVSCTAGFAELMAKYNLMVPADQQVQRNSLEALCQTVLGDLSKVKKSGTISELNLNGGATIARCADAMVETYEDLTDEEGPFNPVAALDQEPCKDFNLAMETILRAVDSGKYDVSTTALKAVNDCRRTFESIITSIQEANAGKEDPLIGFPEPQITQFKNIKNVCVKANNQWKTIAAV